MATYQDTKRKMLMGLPMSVQALENGRDDEGQASRNKMLVLPETAERKAYTG